MRSDFAEDINSGGMLTMLAVEPFQEETTNNDMVRSKTDPKAQLASNQVVSAIAGVFCYDGYHGRAFEVLQAEF